MQLMHRAGFRLLRQILQLAAVIVGGHLAAAAVKGMTPDTQPWGAAAGTDRQQRGWLVDGSVFEGYSNVKGRCIRIVL